MKILLIAPTCNGEDVGEAWLSYQWARHLSERHSVTVLTYHKRGFRPASGQLPHAEVIEWAEPPVVGKAERLNSMLKPAYIPFYIRARRWIRKALAQGRHFDVAHQVAPVAMRYPSPVAGLGIPFAIGPIGGSLASPAAFHDGSTPWFARMRKFDRMRFRWDPLLRKTYGTADCVLGIAPYVGDVLADVHVRRFEVMSDVGLETLPPPVNRAGRKGPVKLLYVGRLVRTKAAQDVVRAMALAPELNMTLDIVGRGPEQAVCEDLIKSLKLEDRVKLQGFRSREEVERFYKNADVFVFPSYQEPGGIVVPEAMAYSLPLIVANRGGPASATTDETAIRLQISTPEALAQDIAEALRVLVNDPKLRMRMGEAGYEFARANALWSAKLERMETIYSEIAKNKG